MRRILAVASLIVSACATTPAVSPGVQLAPDTRPACAANCEKMGLRLAAVVLVRNSAGCVCAVPDAKPAAGAPGTPGTAGAAGASGDAAAVAVAAGALIAEEEDGQQLQAASVQATPVVKD